MREAVRLAPPPLPCSPALVFALALAAAPGASLEPSGPPCAACVVWRLDLAAADRLAGSGAPLPHAELVVQGVDGPDAAARAREIAALLAARGARVGFDVPLDDAAVQDALAPVASRILLRVPPDDPRDAGSLAYQIKLRSVALRGAQGGIGLGLAAGAARHRALRAQGVDPYIAFVVTDAGLPSASGV